MWRYAELYNHLLYNPEHHEGGCVGWLQWTKRTVPSIDNPNANGPKGRWDELQS